MDIQNEKEASKLPKTSPIDTGKGADLTKVPNGITKSPPVKTPQTPPSPPFPTQGPGGTPDTSYSEQGEHVNF